MVSRIDAKDWIVKFRLEKIKKIKMLDKTFKLPKNLKVMLDQSVNIWFSEKRDKKIVLKVDKDVASFFKEKLYFPLQKIVKENKDGSLILESTACQYEEIIPIVLKWIPYVEIVNPKDLKLRIVAKIKQYGAKIGQSLG